MKSSEIRSFVLGAVSILVLIVILVVVIRNNNGIKEEMVQTEIASDVAFDASEVEEKASGEDISNKEVIKEVLTSDDEFRKPFLMDPVDGLDIDKNDPNKPSGFINDMYLEALQIGPKEAFMKRVSDEIRRPVEANCPVIPANPLYASKNVNSDDTIIIKQTDPIEVEVKIGTRSKLDYYVVCDKVGCTIEDVVDKKGRSLISTIEEYCSK